MAALLAAGAWFLIAEAASFSKLLSTLRRAILWWLLLSGFGAALAYLGYALLYQALSGVEGGPRPRLRLTLRVTVAVLGASVIATSAGRLGSEYWSLRRMREAPSSAWSRVLALNSAAWAVLGGLACLGAIALLLGAGRGAPLGVELGWLLAFPICAIPTAYLSSPARRWRAEDKGGRLRRFAGSVVRSLVLLRLVTSRPLVRARGLTGALLHWGGELLIVWGALRAFATTLGPAALVIGFATGYAATMLPLPAGGAGGVDAASTYALTLVGVPLGRALLATLILRLCSYWLPIALAVVSVRSIKRLDKDLARVRRSSPATQER